MITAALLLALLPTWASLLGVYVVVGLALAHVAMKIESPRFVVVLSFWAWPLLGACATFMAVVLLPYWLLDWLTS